MDRDRMAADRLRRSIRQAAGLFSTLTLFSTLAAQVASARRFGVHDGRERETITGFGEIGKKDPD